VTVATATDTVATAETARDLPRALSGGTLSMRAKGIAYLPQEMAESNKAYDIRLKRSFLFNGYAKTVRDMVGKVLGKPITFGDDTPAEIADPGTGWQLNIDLAGRDINSFARDVFTDAFDGVSYILCDMDAPIDGAVTRRDEITMGRRPWLVHIKAMQVLGWRSEAINGVQTLTQFRFMEEASEPNGEFADRAVKQVRVFTKTGGSVAFQLWRQAKTISAEWVIYEEGMTSLSEIAVVAVYTNRTGFFSGMPPLSDLAEVNLAHWQSQSDQRNILHVARVPILFGTGFPEDGAPIEIGAARLIRVSDPTASLTYVEHSGGAIGSGRDDLKDLEFQMQVLGLELLTPKPGGQSATGAVIDQAKMNAPLSVMAQGLEDALENALQFMADYANLETGGSVEINKDFNTGLSSADANTIIAMRTAGVISNATVIREMQRRQILSDDLDPDAETLAAMNDGFLDDDTLPDTGSLAPR